MGWSWHCPGAVTVPGMQVDGCQAMGAILVHEGCYLRSEQLWALATLAQVVLPERQNPHDQRNALMPFSLVNAHAICQLTGLGLSTYAIPALIGISSNYRALTAGAWLAAAYEPASIMLKATSVFIEILVLL